MNFASTFAKGTDLPPAATTSLPPWAWQRDAGSGRAFGGVREFQCRWLSEKKGLKNGLNVLWSLNIGCFWILLNVLGCFFMVNVETKKSRNVKDVGRFQAVHQTRQQWQWVGALQKLSLPTCKMIAFQAPVWPSFFSRWWPPFKNDSPVNFGSVTLSSEPE